MKISRLQESNCGLLVIDFQEKFASRIQNWDYILGGCMRLIKFFRLIQAPIVVTEQYPKALGSTVTQIRETFSGFDIPYRAKTAFSSCGADDIKREIEKHKKTQWVLSGIESHV